MVLIVHGFPNDISALRVSNYLFDIVRLLSVTLQSYFVVKQTEVQSKIYKWL